MTLKECTALLTPLALALRADVDDPTFRAYHKLLKDVPASLAAVALDDLAASGLEFFPTAPKIRNACERARRRLLALRPYDGCADCEGHVGFRTIQHEGGHETVERCPCRARHRALLADYGLLAPIAMLPDEASGESEQQAYPTADQIPAPLRAQLDAVITRKVLR